MCDVSVPMNRALWYPDVVMLNSFLLLRVQEASAQGTKYSPLLRVTRNGRLDLVQCNANVYVFQLII